MQVYVIRHGQSEYNKRRIIQGNLDIPLSEEGVRQALEARERLLARGITSFDRIYSSPLQRAYVTGEIVSGRSHETFLMDRRLREIEVGGLQGKSYADPSEAMDNFMHHPERYVPLPGGESYQDLAERAGAFLSWLAGRDLPERTLVCTHNGWMHAMLMAIDGLKAEDIRKHPVKNCTVYVLEPDGKGSFQVADIIENEAGEDVRA